MASSEVKTTENDGDVTAFLASVDDETRRRDALVLLELMERVTGNRLGCGDPRSSASAATTTRTRPDARATSRLPPLAAQGSHDRVPDGWGGRAWGAGQTLAPAHDHADLARRVTPAAVRERPKRPPDSPTVP